MDSLFWYKCTKELNVLPIENVNVPIDKLDRNSIFKDHYIICEKVKEKRQQLREGNNLISLMKTLLILRGMCMKYIMMWKLDFFLSVTFDKKIEQYNLLLQEGEKYGFLLKNFVD